ncbi:MAG: exonuclease subunit SbcD [Prochloraceae cyanobacterium]|nr:exonuclease subunit SbcD [Prochloraceae cyanobacterium]
MINILHFSDIHMGSGFSHGQIDPATGLNTRLQDFIETLSKCIDRAIGKDDEPVDLVLFAGDAFPDATPPPYIQEAFAKQFRRLADANIPTVLLVGNHDQHSQGSGGASLCIYRTLAVPGFIVGDKINTHRITTANGDIQVITLPWLTRSNLLTTDKTEGLSIAEVNDLLIENLKPVLESEIRKLDPNIPTVLVGHLMADRATFGAEKFLAVGKGFTIPISLLTRPEFEYVALGHVHKHQNLNPNNNPPIVYPGSIERVDFSEEKEDKGYVIVKVEKGRVNWEFCPLTVRSFCTVKCDVSQKDDAHEAILEAIAKQDIKDVVVRLIYKLRSEQLDLVETASLYQALKPAHSYTIRAELLSQLTRPRLPELSAGASLDPIEALAAYLKDNKDLKDIEKDMLAAAETLLDRSFLS